MLGPLLVGGFVNRPQRCWRAEKPSRLRCRCGAFANAPYDSEAIAGSRRIGGERNASYGFEVVLTPSASGEFLQMPTLVGNPRW
jgi:hypothetical protein